MNFSAHTRARVALPALIVGVLGIALAPLWVRWSEVGPSATGFYRLLLASPVLWLWFGWESARPLGGPRPSAPRDYFWLGVVGLSFAGDLAFWHWSIALTSIGNATLLANAAPLFVALGARYFFGERITPGFLAGLGVALAGGVLLAKASLDLGQHRLAGDALGLLTAVFYATYQLSLKHLRGRFSTAATMAWSGLAACPVLLLAAVASHEVCVPSSSRGWWVMVVLALSAQVAGQPLIAYAAAYLPATQLSVLLLLQPPFVAVLGWWLFKERMTPAQILGSALVLAGVALVRLTRVRPSAAKPGSA